jgi:hypothetical protein
MRADLKRRKLSFKVKIEPANSRTAAAATEEMNDTTRR